MYEWLRTDEEDIEYVPYGMGENCTDLDDSDEYDYTYEDYKLDIPDGTYETYLEVVNPRKWNGSPNRPQF